MKVPLLNENFSAIFRIDFQYISRIRTIEGYSKAPVIKVFFISFHFSCILLS